MKIRIFYYIYQELEDSSPIIESWMSESFGGNSEDQTFHTVREMIDRRHNGDTCVSVCAAGDVGKVVGVKWE